MISKITVPPILPETFEKIVAPWLYGIARKDIVAVMSYPASDRQRRVLQLLGEKKIQKKYLGAPDRFLWVHVDFRVDPIDDVIDLETHIQKASHAKRGRKVILVCIGCEKLLQKKNLPILIWFTIQSRVDRFRMLLFFETNLLRSDVLTMLASVPAFQPRIFTMMLYKEPDIRQFLLYLEKKWSMKISDSVKRDIVKTCGGVFLLVKEAVWYLRDHPNAPIKDVFNHTEMQFNLALLWNGFRLEEQQVLDALITRSDIRKVHHAAIRYLERTGFVKKEGARFFCTVPLLLEYRRAMIFLQHQMSIGSHGEVLLDGTNVSSHFSRAQRRILTVFIQHQSHLVSRDEVARALWPVDLENNYSDWAIDSHVSRLRTKLVQLNVSEESIRTIKGKGFILHEKKRDI